MDSYKDEPTAHDYFAVHAPRVPKWFFHKRPEHYGNSPNPREFFESEADIALATDWFADPCYDLTEDMKGFADACKEWWLAKNTWNSDDKMARAVQWRWYWADKMMASR